MLTLQDDESIHSLIFRTHKINGISDFSNIINAKGIWNYLPRIIKDTLNFYEPIDEAVILNLLREIKLAAPTTRMFNNPTNYRVDLQYFFNTGGVRTSRTNHYEGVNYCLPCMQEQIKTLGFAYFKNIWCRIEFCHSHNIPLTYIPKKSRSNTLPNLDIILRGLHPTEYFKYRWNVQHDTKYDVIIPEYHDTKYDVIIPEYYIAKCLAEKLGDYILTNKHLVSEATELYMSKLISNKFNFDRLTKVNIVRDYILENICISLQKKQPHFLLDFHSLFSVDMPRYGGVINNKQLKEPCYKLADLECSACTQPYCFTLISYGRL